MDTVNKMGSQKKRIRRILAAALLVFLTGSLYGTDIQATQSQIDKVQDNIKDLEQKKNEARQQADSLSDSASILQGDLKKLNDNLNTVTSELNTVEARLREVQGDLEQTKERLKQAEKQEKKQYHAMKKRIQFLYEMEADSTLEILMESKNIVDFLNRSEYIVSIYQYDRTMLEAYRTTKEEIASAKEKLEKKEEQLAELKEQEQEKKQELLAFIDDKSKSLKAAKKQMEKARADAESYEAELERQKAYEEELEAKKAAEDAARLEEIRRQEEALKESEKNNKPIKADASEKTLLAAIIQCEAGGESYEGKLAVGSVVANRVRSSHFPNSIAGVIYQKGQFSPVASGRFAKVLAEGPNRTCQKAAAEVLGGRITVDSLYFRRNTGAIDGLVIGNHVFY